MEPTNIIIHLHSLFGFSMVADFLDSVINIFTSIQVYTGLSAPAVLFMLGTVYKTVSGVAKETDSIMAILASVAFWIIFWWLVGYLIINPLWNMFLGQV